MVSPIVNPFGFQDTPEASGNPFGFQDALTTPANNLAGLAAAGVQLAQRNQFATSEASPEPSIGYNRARKEFYVQGITFKDDDAQALLQSETLLDSRPTGFPTNNDFIPLGMRSYKQLIQNARDPSLETLATRNFGRGVDVMQLLAGRALQAVGAEETGGKIVEQQVEDLRKTAPFEREFTDIDSSKGAVDWLVANFAQQGPNLIESVAAAVTGFVAGTAASGTPIGGALAAFAALVSKAAWKQSVKAALTKRLKNESLNFAEQKLLRNAAGITGAVAASFGADYGIGVGDIYGELRDQGANADDTVARLKALSGAPVYAALDILPEYALALRVFKGVGAPAALRAGTSLPRKGAELLRRGAVGGAVAGTVEGTEELGQEALLLGLSDQDFEAPENIKRLINSFAAGAGIGSPLGTIAHLRGRQPANLLNPAQNPEPVGTQGVLNIFGELSAEELAYRRQPRAPASEASPLTILPEINPAQGELPFPRQNQVAFPFIDQSQAQPVVNPIQPVVNPTQPVFNPAQGALQFSGPAPQAPFNPQISNQLQAIRDRLRRQREFEAAQAQQQALIQRQTEQLAQQSQNARDLFILQQAQQVAAVEPTQQDKVAQATQLELFKRREAPRPSRREALRRGIPGTRSVAAAPIEVSPTATQLSIFNQEGQPTIAALKGAGLKRKIVVAPAKPPVVRLRTQRGLKRQAGVAAVEIVPKEAPRAVQKRSTTSVVARKQPKTSGRVGAGIPTERKTAGKGSKLKTKGKEKKEKQKSAIQVEESKRPKTQAAPVAAKEAALVAAKEAAPVAAKETAPVAAKELAPILAAEVAPVAAKTQAVPVAAKKAEKAQVKVEPLPPADAWEDMKPEGAPTFDKLPASVRAEWRQIVASNKATIRRAEELFDTVEETPLQMVETEFSVAAASIRNQDFHDSIDVVIEFAYFVNEETNTKAAIVRARELLTNTTFSDAQQNIIDALVLKQANALLAVEAIYTRGENKGNSKPWFDYVTRRGLLPGLNTVVKGLPIEAAKKLLASGQLRTANLPVATANKLKTPNPGTKQGTDTRSNAATILADYIKEQNTKPNKLNKTQQQSVIKKLSTLWAAVLAAKLESFLDHSGTKLSAYFNAAGVPYTGTVKGSFRVATEKLTPAVRAKREKLIDESSNVTDDAYEAPFSLDDWNIKNTGRYYYADGTPITKPVSIGRTKLLAIAFLSRLKIRPKIYVYRNQTDFKAKNPSLYAQAVAARPQGDFDTANATGYSFGNGNVIIFADRIVTEQQLKFTLAHESLGHFGFGSLLTPKELRTALDAVYNSSAKVKAAVNTAMEARKISRQEATEEYLADFAGILDTNIISRFWNAIKNILNSLGIQFDDDAARYLVSQSRRYVRNGVTKGTFVDYRTLAQRLGDIESITDPDNAGRFALAGEYYDEINRVAASNAFGQRSTKLFDLTSIFQEAKDNGINIGDFANRLIDELKLMNFLARENQGYRRLYDIFRDTSKVASQLRAQYNKMMNTVLSPSVELLSGQLTKGATKEQINRTSAMLNVTSRVKLGSLTDADLRKMASLITIDAGEANVNQEVFSLLAARGKHTLEEFKQGIIYTIDVARPITEEQKDALRAERNQELSEAVSDKDRRAIEREYQKLIDNPSGTVEVEQVFTAIPELTEDSPEWIMYNEVRDTMNQSALDMLLANYTAAKGERVNVEHVLQRFLDRALTENDRAFITTIEDKYLELRSKDSTIDASGVLLTKQASIATADEFAKKFNAAVLGRDTDRNQDVQEFFDDAKADDIFAGIEALKKGSNIPHSGPDRFIMQQAVQNLALFELSKTDAELFAKRSIAGGYVPFGREGSWQVRIQATDPQTGRIYKISEQYRQHLLFAQVKTRAQAEAMAERVQSLFDDVENGFELEVLDGADFVVKKVKLVAHAETARETVTVAAEANLNEIIATLTRFSISITPEERKNLIVGLTKQNAKARTRLRRANTPGEDPNTIKYVSQHLESTASTVARKRNRHRLDRLFDDKNPEAIRLWFGDKLEYERRKTAWETAKENPNMSEAQKFAIKREFDDYHYTFVTKNSPVMGNRFKDRGRRAVAFMESQQNVDYTDFASGDAASVIRTATTFTFMGASFATALLNYMALATNVVPALAGYNEKNAFGGGFGWGLSTVEVSRATNITRANKQSEVKFWDDLLADPDKLAASGFTEAEALFMQKEVGGGTMQAALTNALLGSARGKFRSGATKAAAQTWMSLFNFTEQHSRRATGLATFRLAYARALAEGKDKATAFEAADRFAVDMINNTLGDYALHNRPALFRGDVRQFLFIFKTFPVNSILMLSALARKEQLLALGILALFSGLKGLPFADDLADIIDTIAQALGLGPSKLWKGSAERTLAEALDAIAPGMTPVLMRGFLNSFTPANVADRVSLSNVFPGTGIALAGANVGRELVEIAGPVASFMQGALVTAANAAKWGLGTAGVIDDTTSFNKVLRESPAVAFRALGDMMAYNNAGAIINRKGYVVSNDLHLGTMLTRALSFYPASAVAENDVVRMAKRVGDYQKEITTTYRGLYIGAKLAKDERHAREVVQMVRDWNKAAKGTGLEIGNFESLANRALREAKRTTTERFLRSVSRTLRPETQRIIDLLS